MAATRLIALHVNKGKTVAQCLADRTDYSQNAAKTNDGEFISSYECDPKTADEEFLLSKRQYQHITGRQQKNNIIAYQIRQSFKPGEITPEEANQVGYETAMRWTKGKHAFIVATHIDKSHIHNHIIYNSTSLDATRKFKNFFLSGLAVQRLSDGYIFYIGGCTMAEMRKRTSMSVLEMGRMLGLGKTESYWLIKKNYFKTILVGNTMRVMIDSFEEWYANQFKYQKVDGTPPGEELKKTTYSMEELGQRLGLKEATAYELVAKGHFDVVDVLGKRRVTKESFERWYASQTDYRTVEDQELDADIMASTYGLPEMARMLGVHRQTIYYIVANEDFELIKVGRYKRATKESFEKWYHNQTRYQLAEDRQERS